MFKLSIVIPSISLWEFPPSMILNCSDVGCPRCVAQQLTKLPFPIGAKFAPCMTSPRRRSFSLKDSRRKDRRTKIGRDRFFWNFRVREYALWDQTLQSFMCDATLSSEYAYVSIRHLSRKSLKGAVNVSSTWSSLLS